MHGYPGERVGGVYGYVGLLVSLSVE
jgi:hypothetical protein